MSPQEPDGTTTGTSSSPKTSMRCRAIARASSHETGVEGGLTAAGLIRRHVHSNAKPFEQRHGGEADLRVDGVDEAGDEQFHARRPRLGRL